MFEDRASWLAWRRLGVGASDVAGILGISPYASPWSVWADKVHLLADRDPTDAMLAGKWLELAIGPWFAHETGLAIAGEQLAITHPEHTHHRATVDGLVFDTPPEASARHEDLLREALGGQEIKHEAFGRPWSSVPAHYEAQAWWQMHVGQLERVWVTVLQGRRLTWHLIERDQTEIDFIVARVDRFWAEHVLTGTPPATDNHDATIRAIAAVYPKETPGASVALDTLTGTLTTWQRAKDNERAAEKAKKAAAAEITAALGAAEEGTVAGQRVVSWRAQTRTTTCGACGHAETSDPFRVLRPHKPKKES
jgi:putative phage-type endonuclease